MNCVKNISAPTSEPFKPTRFLRVLHLFGLPFNPRVNCRSKGRPTARVEMTMDSI